ncbi:hypothetical protein N7448_006462 [Penicillium atrosanguineum]|uniref:Uncharacterized protein n=1 Tax=Penicillium atrosanguineum TaxID=1132637 RepID=A0A9W9PUA2_9EURO|nr:uncharacterized protein N7443_010224 [Penicillium atrosanguineum]KAJ5132304.1 hypothetical protein N7448_006462 [Penicillium atrosanguineum]KAJ5137484.1 hypothetical protein N7526_003717 [Penicillium atrosanguineum]KAJ5289971.1 hypothetical protein N7443_010224 [Penicillium atrosanguineum]KAJ5307793.1 hypothetical protein N7476_008449 [Penicillium atrosanguineum]
MREFLLPGIAFFSSSLWGFYGNIPFTTVKSSRPFMDRAVGCTQLATAAYAVEQAYQNISTTYSLHENTDPAATETNTFILPDFNARWNITLKIPALAAATRTQIEHETFIFPPNWTTQVTMPMSKPICKPTPAANPDLPFENMALIMLAILLALGTKQAFNYEVTDLAHRINPILSNPPAWIYNLVNDAIPKSVSHALEGCIQAIGNHLIRIETCGAQLVSQLFAFGQDLNRLREDFLIARHEIYAARIDVTNTIHTSIQNAIQTSLEPALGTFIQDAAQNAIQGAVQTSIHNAVQATAANSDIAHKASNDIIIQMLNGQNDIQRGTEEKLGRLSDIIGKGNSTLSRSVN